MPKTIPPHPFSYLGTYGHQNNAVVNCYRSLEEIVEDYFLDFKKAIIIDKRSDALIAVESMKKLLEREIDRVLYKAMESKVLEKLSDDIFVRIYEELLPSRIVLYIKEAREELSLYYTIGAINYYSGHLDELRSDKARQMKTIEQKHPDQAWKSALELAGHFEHAIQAWVKDLASLLADDPILIQS